MPSPADTMSAQMRARYGLVPGPWWKRVLAVGVGAVLVAALLYGAWQVANPSVTWQVTAFHVRSPQLTTISFDLQRSARTTVDCVIRAQDQDSTDVGYATVRIPPGAAELAVTYPLATRATAVIVDVLGCSDNGPPRVPDPQFPPGTANPSQQPSVAGG